jgi:uncharacterized HAD superfamily protein
MKIGVDIDDTVANTSELIIQEALNYNFKNFNNKQIKNKNAFHFTDMFGWSDATYHDFLKEFFTKENVLKIKPKADAIKVINELSKQNEIYFITYRHFPAAYDITKEWLDTNGFKYKQLIINSGNKGLACKQNDIAIFIDDMVNHCEEVRRYNIPVLLMDSPYNQMNKELKRVRNWAEVLAKLSK